VADGSEVARTHLMDAVPVTLARSSAIRPPDRKQASERVAHAAALGELAIGEHRGGHASTLPRASVARGGRGAGLPRLVCPSGARRQTSFEAQAPVTGWSRRPGRCHHRGVADQDRQRHPLDGVGPADWGRLAESSCPTCSPAVDHARKVNPVLPEAVTQVAAQ